MEMEVELLTFSFRVGDIFPLIMMPWYSAITRLLRVQQVKLCCF